MIKGYGEMIRESIDKSMAEDKNIFLFGEDIGNYGGAFGITRGLIEKYGPERVIDSPMSEQSIIGLGVGAALNGLKPIVELMFMDFITLCYDQIFNHAAIFSYLSGGELSVPLIIRTPYGGGRGYGATHSKTLAAPLMNVPGIKIVAPSNSEDAGGLLRAALKEKCPVIFMENKLLYGLKEEVDENKEIEIGKGRVAKSGKDILIITFGKSVKDSVEIASEMENKGISVEVLDLITLKPLDLNLIIKEVQKIKKVIIVEEGYQTCGVASEIISVINESCFYYLKCPVKRVCSLEVPIPCSPKLENLVMPSKERILKAVMEIKDE